MGKVGRRGTRQGADKPSALDFCDDYVREARRACPDKCSACEGTADAGLALASLDDVALDRPAWAGGSWRIESRRPFEVAVNTTELTGTRATASVSALSSADTAGAYLMPLSSALLSRPAASPSVQLVANGLRAR